MVGRDRDVARIRDLNDSLRRTGRQVFPAGIKQLARHNAACFTHNTGYQQLSRRNRETTTDAGRNSLLTLCLHQLSVHILRQESPIDVRTNLAFEDSVS